VKGARYSVPCEWKLLVVRTWLYADEVVIVWGGRRVHHARQPGNGKSIWYPHYLSELAKKPQAIEQVAETLMSQLGPPYERTWARLSLVRGSRAAGRAFKVVLRFALDHGIEVTGRALQRALDRAEDPILALREPTPSPANTVVPARLARYRIEPSPLSAYSELSGVSS
jgi:hypothetical protein